MFQKSGDLLFLIKIKSVISSIKTTYFTWLVFDWNEFLSSCSFNFLQCFSCSSRYLANTASSSEISIFPQKIERKIPWKRVSKDFKAVFLFLASCLLLSPTFVSLCHQNKSTTRVKCKDISQQVWLKKYLLGDAPTYSNICGSFKPWKSWK